MPKFLLTFLAVLNLGFSFAQKTINNVKTADHKQVKGTQIFLAPPAGFMNAESFHGFQQLNSGSSIMVIEIPGPFSESTKGFNQEGLKTQGVIMKKKEDVTVNGMPGLLITAEQFANGTNYSKHVLAFGNDKVTFMVNGIFPKELQDLEKDVVQSMLSIVYDQTLSVDPLSVIGSFYIVDCLLGK